MKKFLLVTLLLIGCQVDSHDDDLYVQEVYKAEETLCRHWFNNIPPAHYKDNPDLVEAWAAICTNRDIRIQTETALYPKQ